MWIESERTLMLEKRKFGYRFRASAFVMTRKMGLTMPGCYEARKKNGSRFANSAMEADNSGQAPMKLSEMVQTSGWSSEKRNSDQS